MVTVLTTVLTSLKNKQKKFKCILFCILIIYTKKLFYSDWLRAVQKFVILRNYNYKNVQSDWPRNNSKLNQSRATRKWRDLTCYAWCDKKIDGGLQALTVPNLLIIVNVNAEAARAV